MLHILGAPFDQLARLLPLSLGDFTLSCEAAFVSSVGGAMHLIPSIFLRRGYLEARHVLETKGYVLPELQINLQNNVPLIDNTK